MYIQRFMRSGRDPYMYTGITVQYHILKVLSILTIIWCSTPVIYSFKNIIHNNHCVYTRAQYSTTYIMKKRGLLPLLMLLLLSIILTCYCYCYCITASAVADSATTSPTAAIAATTTSYICCSKIVKPEIS